MRSWWRVVAIGAAAIAACKFAPLDQHNDGNPVDSPGSAADAGPCLGASVECADPDTLRTCLVAGGNAVDTPCAWGCGTADAPHCMVLVPSGGAATSADLDPTGLMATTLPDGAQIDGSAGSIDHGIRDMGGNNTIDKGVGWSLRGNVAVFRFGDLTIAGKLKFAQPGDNSQPYAAIVLVSSGSITINGAIDAEGNCMGQSGGPGGFVAGTANNTAAGSGGGGGGTNDQSRGGGGGGYGSNGGSGGNDGTNPTPAGGTFFGDDVITLLIGGGGGGGGGHGNTPHGGGGGGAMQLVANQTITINATGSINAGGCSGKSGDNNGGGDAGGGGGAGGTILLEAHDIVIAGQLAVNGGGGGAGNAGNNDEGGSAALGRAPALGSTRSAAAGGNGGWGSALGGSPGLAADTYGGGGGGSVGRIRFNTRTGSASVDNSMLSPALTDSPTTCTLGSAATQ